ncbi:helix-turn-helix domain-containing protein [Flavobacterium sp. '19STA2R22 D10 B1']|uniref:LexA family transcriptional regulator n=1 Tax=Flavobacterium aerium TaxID=3037261 RepID=UPI00278BAF2A|nr:helix-turn-helix domain-containing protein [Flavobacterium sp. '19STA2R22 D10 B1']
MQENNSLNANLILKRLKKTLKINTDIELSTILNIKPNTISTWKKRNSLDYPSIIAICELYDVDLNKILLGREDYKKKETLYATETPLIGREVQFQYVLGNNNTLLDNLPKYNFPFLKGKESRAFQVVGNNMYPLLEENSYVLCEESNIYEIQTNNIYVIVSKEKGLFINKVELNSAYPEQITLVDEKKDLHPEIELSLSEIDEVWNVKMVFSFFNGESISSSLEDKIKRIGDILERVNLI